MKKSFSVFDGLFLLALYFKLSGTVNVSWLGVVAPCVLEMFVSGLLLMNSIYGWDNKPKIWLIKILSKKTFNDAVKAAKAQAESEHKREQRRANPGQHIDPKNLGK